MARREEFDVELEGTPVRVKLDLPDRPSDGKPLPAVLLCHGQPELSPDARRLIDQVTEALTEAGMAVADIARGSGGAPAPIAAGVAATSRPSALFRLPARSIKP